MTRSKLKEILIVELGFVGEEPCEGATSLRYYRFEEGFCSHWIISRPSIRCCTCPLHLFLVKLCLKCEQLFRPTPVHIWPVCLVVAPPLVLEIEPLVTKETRYHIREKDKVCDLLPRIVIIGVCLGPHVQDSVTIRSHLFHLIVPSLCLTFCIRCHIDDSLRGFERKFPRNHDRIRSKCSPVCVDVTDVADSCGEWSCASTNEVVDDRIK